MKLKNTKYHLVFQSIVFGMITIVTFACTSDLEEKAMDISTHQEEIINGPLVSMGFPAWTFRIVRIGSAHSKCTGTLINRRWVLTAKHCNVSVGEGVYSERGDSTTVAEVHEAPKNEGTYENDAVLLKLTKRLNPAKHVNGMMPLYEGPAADLPGEYISCYGYGYSTLETSGDSCDDDGDCPRSYKCFGHSTKWCVSDCASDADCSDGNVCRADKCTGGYGDLRSMYTKVIDQSSSNPHRIRTYQDVNGAVLANGDSGGPCVKFNSSNSKWELAAVNSTVSPSLTYSKHQHIPSFDGWMKKTIENE